MKIRRKLAVIAAAITVPLAGVAVAGGIQAATAGGGPLLTCQFVDSTTSGIEFDGGGGPGTAGIFLNANLGGSYKLVANATGLSNTLVITGLAQTGETLTIMGDATTYTVTSDITPSAPNYNPTDLQITPALPAATGKTGPSGVIYKAKTVVTVNPTDGSNNTTLYNPSQTEDLTVNLNGCTSSTTIPGDFSPTGGVSYSATGSVSNAATGLEGKPTNINGTVTFPSIGANWVTPVATTMDFGVPKADSTNLTNFNVTYGFGVVTGDYASAKAGHLALNALVSMTVCTAGELQAIELGTGPDSGTIAKGANPLVVCDGGTSSAYGGNGLDEILAAETNTTGAADNGADGTPILAIYQISLTESGNSII